MTSVARRRHVEPAERSGLAHAVPEPTVAGAEHLSLKRPRAARLRWAARVAADHVSAATRVAAEATDARVHDKIVRSATSDEDQHHEDGAHADATEHLRGHVLSIAHRTAIVFE